MEVKRTEHKFLLNKKEALAAQAQIGAVMPADIHCASDGYEIRSLYFDTISDRSCAEKEDGLETHEKIRVRIYGRNDSVIKLECKKKVGEAQSKKGMLIDRSTLDHLIRGDYSVLLSSTDPLAPFFYRKLAAGMMPKAIIQYRRMSYCLPSNQTRITFDYNIRATESSFDLFQEPLLAHPIFPSDQVIMEVKYNHFLFGYLKKTLASIQKSPTSFSKYYSGRSFRRSMI